MTGVHYYTQLLLVRMTSWEHFCLSWSLTVILQIMTSRVSRITCLSYWAQLRVSQTESLFKAVAVAQVIKHLLESTRPWGQTPVLQKKKTPPTTIITATKNPVTPFPSLWALVRLWWLHWIQLDRSSLYHDHHQAPLKPGGPKVAGMGYSYSLLQRCLCR
jgi:hypothetical protein